jgi:DNA-directed RNA polymerase subunit RPC12/RpoP
MPQVNLKERERRLASPESASSASPSIYPSKFVPIVSLGKTQEVAETGSESSSSENESEEEEDTNWTPSKNTIQAWKFPKQRARKRKISSSSSTSEEMSTLEQMAPPPPAHAESQAVAPNLSLFNSQSELRQIVYKCDKCATLFTTELALLSHKHQKHSKQTSSAELSILNSPSANLFSVPKAIAKPMPLQQKKPPGNLQKKPLKNSNSLRHSKPKPKKFKCTECSKQFDNNYSLKDHMEFHKGLTKCVYCKFVYCSAYSLKRHLTATLTKCAEKHKKSTNQPGSSGTSPKISAPKVNLSSTKTVISGNVQKQTQPQAAPKIVGDVICID